MLSYRCPIMVGVRVCELQGHRWKVLFEHSSTVLFVSGRRVASGVEIFGLYPYISVAKFRTAVLKFRSGPDPPDRK